MKRILFFMMMLSVVATQAQTPYKSLHDIQIVAEQNGLIVHAVHTLCNTLHNNAMPDQSLIEAAFMEAVTCLEHCKGSFDQAELEYLANDLEAAYDALTQEDFLTKRMVNNISVRNKISAGNAAITGNTTIGGNVIIAGNETIGGNVIVQGTTIFEGDVIISGTILRPTSATSGVTSISAGTGITLTPNPITTTGTVALTVPVSIANGGTNAITMTNADGVVYYDGTSLLTTAAGNAGQVLVSNGGSGSAPTFQTLPSSTSITLTADMGSATGPSVAIHGGTNISTIATGTIVTVNVIDSPIVAGLLTVNGGANLNVGGTANTSIGTGGNTGTVSIGNGSSAGVNILGPVQINNGGVSNTLIGTSANSGTILIGNASSAAIAVTGATSINSSGNKSTVIGSGASSVTIAGSTAINASVGTSATTIGGGSGLVQINAIGSATGTTLIGNNAAAGSSTIISGTVLMPNVFGAFVGASNSPVIIDNSGKLGTQISSKRFKENFRNLDADSAQLYNLKPVKFDFKKEYGGCQDEIGLIAEEVAECLPGMVIHNKNGEIQSVKYHVLPTLLLNELIHHKKQLDEQKDTITTLRAKIALMEAAISRLP